MPSSVILRGALKSYNGNAVLDGLDMTVPEGAIYGLLGASGCGKTTLLSCLVGKTRFDHGTAWILGKRFRNKPVDCLGPRLGYMPQDVALVSELSIANCASYFGSLYGMSKEEINERLNFYERLLDLPDKGKYIKNLSGGQMRRVSLAVTLLHDPELLILDEPTVGLDPILRYQIWQHLAQKASLGRTIIITTHYIEEVTQSNVIGLMRNGRLLEEGAPDILKAKYECDTIEQVFLSLCVGQDENRNKISIQSQMKKFIEDSSDVNDVDVVCKNWTEGPNYSSTRSDRIKALIRKNILRVLRHPGSLLFTFVLPLLEIVIFFMAIGGTPRNLRIGIVNEEITSHTVCPEYTNINATHPLQYHIRPQDYDVMNDTVYSDLRIAPYPLDCDYQNLSCAFISDFHHHLDTELAYFSSLENAQERARKGELAGVIHFSKFFTPALLDWLAQGRETDEDTLRQSHISAWMDMTERHTGFILQQNLFSTYRRLITSVLEGCGADGRVGKVPVHFMPPVFGLEDSTYGTYIAPGVLVTLIFFLAVTVTSIIIIIERDEGSWSRTLVAGVSTSEILISHFFTQGCAMVFQTIELLFVSMVFFNLRCAGHLFDLTVLLLLQGLCGVCAGLSISAWCDTVFASNFIAMGSFVPIIFMSGSLWPLEGMPTVLRMFAMCMPTTLGTEAVRNVLEKGWRLNQPRILIGCGSTVAWITILCTFSGILLQRKK